MSEAVLPYEFTIKNNNELYAYGFYFCDEDIPKATYFFITLANDAEANEICCEIHLINDEGKTIKILKKKKELNDER